MIEVLALASAVSTIAGGISSAVQAGKDVGSVLPQFGKLAKLEADIHLAEQGRHKGPLGRLTSTEEEGFAIANAKMKHKEAMDTLRSHCRLYGPPGCGRRSSVRWAQLERGRNVRLRSRQQNVTASFTSLQLRLPAQCLPWAAAACSGSQPC